MKHFILYCIALIMLKKSQADGSPPKPSMPASWNPSRLQKQKSGLGEATEAQRLARAFGLYLLDTPDDAAVFDLGEYNELDRGQGLHPACLAGPLVKPLVDHLLQATKGKIHCKQSLHAAIREVIRLHPKRKLTGKHDVTKFVRWLKVRVSLCDRSCSRGWVIF